MRASDFEFRYRFFFLVAVVTFGFLSYRIDPVNVAAALGGLISGADPAAGQRVFLWLGLVITLAGAALRTWASAYLGTDVVGDSVFRTEVLVANGPYRFVRNPLYLGLILLAAGLGLAASRVGWVIMVAGTTLFLMRLALREEAELLAQQGEAYRAFLNRVPRLLPSLRPLLPPGPASPRWGQAFFGEIMMWGCVVAMAALAFTRDPDLFERLIALSLAGYVVARLVVRFKGGAQARVP